MNISDAKKRMTKDTLLYLPAKAIEGIVGILTIAVYTRFFTPEVYGYYNLITTTTNILCIVLLWWLIQSGVRYINGFNSPMKLKLFFSTTFTVWASVNGLAILAGLISLMFARPYLGTQYTLLIFFSILMFVSFNTTQTLFSLLAAIRRIKLTLVLSIFSITAKLILTSVFVYTAADNSVTPISAVLSNVIIEFIVVAVIVARLQLYKYIRLKFFSLKVLKKFLVYGMPIMGVSLAMSLLNMSDRYVIIFSLGPVDGPSQAGIYAANYSIASAVFNIILVAVMRGVYPMILKPGSKATWSRPRFCWDRLFGTT
jgi:O-antigen/teichoic acid export membrane protein